MRTKILLIFFIANVFVFAGIGVGESGVGPVPVELTSFDIVKHNNSVLLTWNTAVEVNNFGFEIERKSVPVASWEKIGFVEGNGNSNSPKSYSFVDEKPLEGKSVYRLKQIDNNGAFKYSEIKTLTFSSVLKFALEQNYPNPFNPSTIIKYELPEQSNVKIEIFDMLGQSVDVLINSEKQAGFYETTWNASNLPSGVYLINIKAEGLNSKKNFVQVKKALLLR